MVFVEYGFGGLTSLVMIIYLYQQWLTGATILIGTTVALYEYANRFTGVFSMLHGNMSSW